MPPQFDIAGVKIFADRVGDHVTGHVQFPYRVYGRGAIPIDYHSARPSEPRTSVRADILDSKAPARLALVNQWNELCKDHPTQSRAKVASVVCDNAPIKCSLRSLEVWSQKFRLEGASGLSDAYTPRPRKTLTLDGELAASAVTVCAWWAFRIGNVEVINSALMHTAATLCQRAANFSSRGSRDGVASCLSSIDRYYSWRCDRRKMPFKPFARWAKWDFDTWLSRAADISDGATVPTIDPAYRDGNFQHPHSAFTAHPVPLQDPVARLPDALAASLPPPTKTRIRDARDRGTVQAIAAISEPRTSVRADSIVAILAPLDDAYRTMLIRASFKDSDARAEAVATLPIWWGLVALPAAKREEIDRVTFIKPSERRPGDEARIARAKVQMFLAELRLLRRPESARK